MLLLNFHVGSEQYAIAAKQVIEILPLTSIKPIPRAPEYVAGLLDYRGIHVPIIDLCQLVNRQDYNKVLSSRIIIVNYLGPNRQSHPLGLIAEKVTETVNIPSEHFSSSGISIEGMSFLGEVTNNKGKMVQFIEVNELLSEEVQNMLFVSNLKDKQICNE